MGKKKFTVLKDLSDEKDQTYVSGSTIDDPPREMFEAEFNEDGQAVIPGTEAEGDSYETKYKFSLALTINAGFGAEKLIVVSGEAPAERIEEIMGQGLKAKRFLRKLRGVIGEPLFPGVESPEIDAAATTEAGQGVGSDQGENF